VDDPLYLLDWDTDLASECDDPDLATIDQSLERRRTIDA
jgi:hypothetical protein